MQHTKEKYGWLVNLSTHGKMLLAFGLLLTLMVTGNVAYLIAQQEAVDTRASVTRTRATTEQLDAALLAVADQEAALRGHAIDASAGFQPAYKAAQARFKDAFGQLRELTRDNPTQQAYLGRLESVLASWQTAIADASATDEASLRKTADLLTRGEGRRLITDLRSTLGEMKQAETLLRQEREQTALRYDAAGLRLTLVLLLASIIAGVASIMLIARHITKPLIDITGLMTRLSGGDATIQIPNLGRKDEIGVLARALQVFRDLKVEASTREWIKTEGASVSARLQEASELRSYAQALLSEIGPRLGCGLAVFYHLPENGDSLSLLASYGYKSGGPQHERYRVGEGLVGQCARERKPIMLTEVPPDYLRIHSSLGEAPPRTVILLPVMLKARVLGVLELASFAPFSELHQGFLDEMMPIIALSLDNLVRAIRTQELLEESQTQTEELRAADEELRTQQEELRMTNEQLEEQSRRLRASEEELRVQAEELQVSNEELQQRTDILREQKRLLEILQKDTQQKAEQLEQTSRYKSEFLANMSHELRTPLNSLLLLAGSMADNEDGTLSKDHQDAARIIHESGNNLLRLINDILDLSKVEAGRMDIVVDDLSLGDFSAGMERVFRPVAKERGLEFSIVHAPGMPASIRQDGAKIGQIISNLLANAFKFTERGSVVLRIGRPEAREAGALPPERSIAISVSDTGIGIPGAQLQSIFEAFQQVDGSTSRKYGGTGLGLTICRSLARLLGGEVRVQSVEGSGSTFTLVLPDHIEATPAAGSLLQQTAAPAPLAALPAAAPAAAAPAERSPSDKPLILIIEDDANFATVVAGMTRRRGCEALIAADGPSGLAAAIKHQPTGIILDVSLPGMDGWNVIEQLKAHPATSKIPVHFISALDQAQRGLGLGAVGFLVKPVTPQAINEAFDKVLRAASDKPRRLLLVDDEAAARAQIRASTRMLQVDVVEARTGTEALALLANGAFDCMVLDLKLPDMDGFDVLERASQKGPLPPVVVYSAKDLSQEESNRLRQFTDSIVVKGGRSPERLLDEVTLFLHSVRETPLQATKAERAAASDLAGKNVLIVDDDMRNVFALSRALRGRGLNVLMAENGTRALTQLESNKTVNLVLMDIMMPGMDGYETMRRIRKVPAWRNLPIIAVSAKAMPGDREKCLEAGADDYLAKPIDLDKLVSMMRVLLAT